MQHLSTLLRDLPLSIADAPDPGDEWAKSPLSALGDAALVDAVGHAISRPKASADSSFLTHAPLELAARAALLAMVEDGTRDMARRRIAAIAARYAREGEEIEERRAAFDDERAAIASLVRSLREGDADQVDATLLFLAPRASVLDLRRALAAEIVPALGAAAHAPILLAELPRIEARLSSAPGLLRAPLRQIALMADVRLAWQDRAGHAPSARDDGRALFEALAAPPPVRSDSPYIAPVMLAVENDGYAERMLGEATAGLSVAAAARVLLRVGAYSMLQDDPDEAPYGWSHAITMPQGVLSCADAVEDATALIRVAATHALGFRATAGKARLVAEPPPRPRAGAIRDVAPIEAAGAAFHAPEAETSRIKAELAARAAAHEDAHLAKYTLACFDAGMRDPGAARLFLAAAASLGAWWDANPGASFE